MSPTIALCLTALLFLGNGFLAIANQESFSNPKPHHDSVIDIDYYSNDDPTVAGSGSGSLKDDETTDDEDLMTSASGSGDNATPSILKTTTTTTTTSKPLSACEQLREASKAIVGNYVPRCTNDGDYAKMQCRGYPGTGNCWCSDLQGRIIPSTNMDQPNVPDCELGSNLRPCVFAIVKYSRKQLLGAMKPECTAEGYFKPVQCQGSMCYCVTPYGSKLEGTEVFIHDTPNCKVSMSSSSTSTTTTKPPTTPRVIVPEFITTRKTHFVNNTPRKTVNPGYTVAPVDKEKVEVEILPDPEEGVDLVDDEDEDDEESPAYGLKSSTHIMTQPGLLAAVIGGAVVTLLCAILLVLFIVYRMRKKDEGSYALDEPRKLPNYSYHRAEKDKEFYA